MKKPAIYRAVIDEMVRLTVAEREVLAGMLAHEVEVGMLEALKALEKFEVPPFEDGYEGSPFHDFVGRMAGDWDWPEKGRAGRKTGTK